MRASHFNGIASSPSEDKSNSNYWNLRHKCFDGKAVHLSYGADVVLVDLHDNDKVIGTTICSKCLDKKFKLKSLPTSQANDLHPNVL